jgi:enamine deaminase RidA (YjgF/YER057c/UK114 family)
MAETKTKAGSMGSKELVFIPETPRGSLASKHNGVIRFVVVAEDGSVTVEAQTADCMEQVKTILAQLGGSCDRMLIVQVWLSDIKRDFAAMNEVYLAWVLENCNGTPPPRACVESKLYSDACLVEMRIEAAEC